MILFSESHNGSRLLAGLLVLMALVAVPVQAQVWQVGMSASGKLITARGFQVDARERPTVVLIGGAGWTGSFQCQG